MKFSNPFRRRSPAVPAVASPPPATHHAIKSLELILLTSKPNLACSGHCSTFELHDVLKKGNHEECYRVDPETIALVKDWEKQDQLELAA